MSYNILICGVGGQGVMLVARILADAALNSKLEVKVAENQGHAKRGGSVSAHVRIGNSYSVMIPTRHADVIVGLEPVEALRNVSALKPEGTIILNNELVLPVVATHKTEDYPSLEQVTDKFNNENLVMVDATDIAKMAGNPLTKNSVMLGALCYMKNLPINKAKIEKSIVDMVPKGTQETNIKAFRLGYTEISKLTQND